MLAGISKDKLPAQQAFARKQSLGYTLLADPSGRAIAAYGVGGAFGFAKRISFLVGADGRFLRTYTKVSPKGHADQVLEDLRALAG